jgi:hypothetical protein
MHGSTAASWTALLLLALAGPAAAWDEAASGQLSVRYEPEDELAAQRVLEIGVEALDRLHFEMGVTDPKPVRITIAPDEAAFRSLTGGSVPEWGVGVAYPSRSFVVLRSPRIIEYPLALGQIVVHELAHVATERGLQGVRAPRWFHEGVAMRSAGEWRLGDLDAMVARVGGGGLIPLRELDVSFPYDSDDAAAAYVESFFAVGLIAERSGIGNASGIVRAVASAGSFESAIERLTGSSLAAFEEDVLSEMGRSYRLPLFLRTDDLFFLLLAVLLVAALAVRMRTSRRRLRELDDDQGDPPRWRPGSDTTWH